MISDEQIDEIIRILLTSPLTYAFGTKEGRERIREWLEPILEAARKEERERCSEICDYPSLGADSETAQEIKRRILSDDNG